jgi:hypothetical protein
VNGTPKTVKARVEKLPCLTGDSLLDTRMWREALRAMWDSSGYPGPATNRRERMADLLCDAAGACHTELHPVGPSDTPCSSHPPSPTPGYYLRARAHSHPFRPLRDPRFDPGHRDTLPDNRPRQDPQRTDMRFSRDRPSDPQDWDHFLLHPAVPLFVVDPEFVYPVAGWLQPSLRDTEIQRRRIRRSGSCDPVSAL